MWVETSHAGVNSLSIAKSHAHDQVKNSHGQLSALLQAIMRRSLDRDILEVSTEPAEEALASLGRCLPVLQTGSISATLAATYTSVGAALISPNQSHVVAVVDRTADLNQAARELVTARFAFGGKSPYAPDLVFVNEFVKSEFLKALACEALPYVNTETTQKTGISSATNRQILCSGQCGAIVDVGQE